MQSPHQPSALLRPLALGTTLLVASLLSGCTGSLNASDSLLGSDLPDLCAPAAVPAAASDGSAPSLNGSLDRSHWATTSVRIERRQVEVQPHYASVVRYGRGNATTPSTTPARNAGLWPTPSTALETSTDGGTLALEGLAAPFHAAFDLVAMPVRMILQPPASTVRSPSNPPCLSPSVSGVGEHPAAITPAAPPATEPAAATAGS